MVWFETRKKLATFLSNKPQSAAAMISTKGINAIGDPTSSKVCFVPGYMLLTVFSLFHINSARIKPLDQKNPHKSNIFLFIFLLKFSHIWNRCFPTINKWFVYICVVRIFRRQPFQKVSEYNSSKDILIKDEFPQPGGVPAEVERPPQQLLHHHAGLVCHRDVDGRHPGLRRGGLRDPQVNALRLFHLLPANLDETTGQATHCLLERRQPSTPGDAPAVHV